MSDYYDIDGNPVTLDKLCRTEPEWAANRIQATDKEIARLNNLLVNSKVAGIIDSQREEIATKDAELEAVNKAFAISDAAHQKCRAELARLREDKPNMCGRHKHRVTLFCEECLRETLKSQ